jgi:Ca2+-binding RTX toxin-like protein
VVYASTTHLLSAQVEDLHLLEGFAIHGTGNARDNLITGNSADNILDGVTGADIMAGGKGNDTYYLDDAGDRVIEQADQGTDTVQSSITHTLGEHLENLILLDFSKPEHGLVDGREVRVYGYPKRNELDYMQGDAVAGFQGTCALTSIANMLTQMGRPTTESQVVTRAIDQGWTVSDPALPAWRLGGSSIDDQRALLDSYGVRHQALPGYNEAGLANLLRGGRGVVVALNAGALWDEAAYQGSGGVNHAVTLSGAVHANDTGELVGFYLSDSGRGLVNDMTRFVDIATFRAAADVAGAYALFTLDPVKLWDEDIDATGNAGDNTLAGNRGHNRLDGLGGHDLLLGEAGNDVLDGGAGDDTLAGGSGDDTYLFGRGGGSDRIVQDDARAQDQDVLQLGSGIDPTQVWFSRSGDDLAIDLVGLGDRVTMAGWFTDDSRSVDQVRTRDGWSLAQRDVQQLVDAMAAFAPADALQVRQDPQALASLVPALAASWHAA